MRLGKRFLVVAALTLVSLCIGMAGYMGLVFLRGAGAVSAPILHGVLDKFHWDNTH